MSLNSSLSSIRFSGLSTGLDTDAIIQSLLRIEQAPIGRYKTRQAQLQLKLSLYEQFQGRLQALKAMGEVLNKSNAFNAVKATTSDEKMATISGGENAQPGQFTISITKLAQAHKMSTNSQTDSTSALGLSGKFLLNGKAIEVAETDTLSQIADRINSAGAGVTAGVVNGGTGNVFLSLTATKSGADNAIQISNVGTGTVLDDLGLSGASTGIRKTTTNGALSSSFADGNTAIGTLLGTTLSSGTIQIEGQAVSIDPSTDSLSTIAQKINDAAIPGVTASVTSTTANGATTYQLKIVGDGSTPSFTDSNHVLENLGILQATPTHSSLAAQDAEYKLDGVNLTSPTNAITDVVAGATITLLDETTSDVTLSLNRDLDAIKTNIKNFVDAYNTIRDFVQQTSTFDTKTYESGPLFGDYSVISNLDTVTQQMTGVVAGLEGKINSLSLVGVSLGTDGKLSFDDSKVYNSLNNNLDQVKALFTEVVTPSDPRVRFVSTTTKTQPSATGYAIDITRAATKGSTTAGTAQTAANSSSETLTFDGALFGSQPVTLILGATNTIDDTIEQINSTASLNGLVTASKDLEGKLVITSQAYGAGKSFTVKSDQTAGSDNTGIGTTDLEGNGLDVAGTINGEVATGKGQVLTGDTGNTYTEGLSLIVTGTTTGSYGTVTYTKGLGAALRDTVAALTDPNTGALSEQDKQIQAQIDGLTKDIENVQKTVARKTEELQLKFGQLEQLISKMRDQQARLAALLPSG